MFRHAWSPCIDRPIHLVKLYCSGGQTRLMPETLGHTNQFTGSLQICSPKDLKNDSDLSGQKTRYMTENLKLCSPSLFITDQLQIIQNAVLEHDILRWRGYQFCYHIDADVKRTGSGNVNSVDASAEQSFHNHCSWHANSATITTSDHHCPAGSKPAREEAEMLGRPRF